MNAVMGRARVVRRMRKVGMQHNVLNLPYSEAVWSLVSIYQTYFKYVFVTSNDKNPDVLNNRHKILKTFPRPKDFVQTGYGNPILHLHSLRQSCHHTENAPFSHYGVQAGILREDETVLLWW